MRKKPIQKLLITSCLAGASVTVCAEDINDLLLDLNLDQLVNAEVTSVSRKSQNIMHAPAAVTIISQEDIKRSGARSIPEVLRMVPGIQSYQINSHSWTISARGNNSAFSTKMLALVDGRPIDSPFSGSTDWSINNFLLEDIERIEVIRGPGAAMWGNNSVNGVINIISKSSRVTQGGYAEAGAGSHEKGFGSVRYGGQVSDKLSYRAHVSSSDHDAMETPGSSLGVSTIKAKDDWYNRNAGFRADWSPAALDSVMLKGDVYTSSVYYNSTSYQGGLPVTIDDDARKNGYNLHGKWNHTLKDNSESILQIWHEYYNMDGPLSEKRSTWDIDYQHQFDLNNRTGFVWGLNYRNIDQEAVSDDRMTFDPELMLLEQFSAFVHTNITLVPKLWDMSISARLEHDDFVDTALNPSIRFSYTPADNYSYWGALSKSHKMPALSEYSTVMQFSPGVVFVGNKDLEAEEVISLEFGHKNQISRDLMFNATIYTNKYENASAITYTPHSQGVTATLENLLSGYAYGAEIAVDWKVEKNWLLKLAYSTVHIEMQSDKPTGSELSSETSSAPNTLSFLSRYDFNNGWKADAWLRYNDHIPSVGLGSLVTMDLSLTKSFHNYDLSIVGKNLFDSQHPEYRDNLSGYTTTEVPRSVYGKISWKF